MPSSRLYTSFYLGLCLGFCRLFSVRTDNIKMGIVEVVDLVLTLALGFNCQTCSYHPLSADLELGGLRVDLAQFTTLSFDSEFPIDVCHK